MPNPRKAIPSRILNVALERDDAAKMDLHLWSEAEQRVPYAARQKFLSGLIREYFGRKAVDLALYFPALAPGSHVYGSPDLMDHLEKILVHTRSHS